MTWLVQGTRRGWEFVSLTNEVKKKDNLVILWGSIDK